MMQLGFVSAILPDLSLEEVLAFAADVGYETVEAMCWPRGEAERRYAGVTHIDVSDFSDQDAARVRELCQRTGVSLSGLGYYPNPLAPDPEERRFHADHLRKVILAARKLGLERVNTFVGRDPGKTIDANWPAFMEVWPPLVAFAEEQGARLGIENCPMLFSNDEWPGGKNLAISPAVWRRMFEAIPSPNFGLNYDPSHLVWQQIDYVGPIYEFGDRFHHVHAKDMRLDLDALNETGILDFGWATPKIPGLGDVDWGAFFSALTDVGYRGPVCVEVEDRAFEGSLEDRKASLLQSYRTLRPLVP